MTGKWKVVTDTYDGSTRRFYVKVIKVAPQEAVMESRTYLWGKHVQLTRGDIGYMLQLQRWGLEINVLKYHRGTTVRGLRVEFAYRRKEWVGL